MNARPGDENVVFPQKVFFNLTFYAIMKNIIVVLKPFI